MLDESVLHDLRWRSILCVNVLGLVMTLNE